MNSKDVLTDARSRAVPWRLIVEALRELTRAGSIDDEGRPWVEVAAHLTGYTTNQLRIGQRTFTSIESFIAEQQLPIHALEWAMSNLEVITRITKANPRRAAEILLSQKQHTLRDLRDIYDQVRAEAGSNISAMSAGHQSAKSFTKNLFGELSKSDVLADVLGLGHDATLGRLKIWPGRHPYVHPDFHVEVLTAGNVQLVAFEGLRFYGDVTSQMATKAALKAAVEATFFFQYYWCTPSWVSLSDLKAMRNKLGLINVGIISVGEKKVEVVLRPLGLAVHDRQSILLQDGTTLARLGIDL